MTKRLKDLTDRIRDDSIRDMLGSKKLQEVYIDPALETLAEYIVKLEGMDEQRAEHYAAGGSSETSGRTF
jgi:hypothetical protein